MTKAQRAHFESLLVAERTRALRDLDLIAQELEEGDSRDDGLADPADSGDLARAAAAATLEATLATRETSSLEEIDDALIRLYHHPDEFGICDVCRQPIDPSRLEMLPVTKVCARHAKTT